MKYNSESFSSLSEAYESLNDQYEIEFESSIHNTSERDSYEVEVVQSSTTIIVGCLKVDSDPLDFFENDDGAGRFHEFSSVNSRDEFLSTLKKSSLFYLVDKYAHGNVHYSVSGTQNYPDQRWDVSHGCAVYIPCDDIQDEYTKAKKKMSVLEAKEKFIKDSNSVLDSYSEFCNGEVYGYSVVTYDKKGNSLNEEECWGFIGNKYANQEKTSIMQSEFNDSLVNELLKEVEIIDFNNIKDVLNLSKEDLQKLHTNVDFNDIASGKYVEVYGDKILSIVNKSEDSAFVYHDNCIDKPFVAKFELWQKNHGVTPEQFAQARLLSDIKEVIRKNLSQDNDKTFTLK